MDLRKVQIKTSRLLLVPTIRKHAQEIFENFTEEIAKMMYPCPTGNIKDTIDFINDSEKKVLAGTELQMTITLLETGDLLGCAGIHTIDKIPEFGIWLKKEAHGHKYGQEAVQGLKDWLDKNVSYQYAVYPAAKENIGSRKIAESLGWILTEEDVFIRQNGEKLAGVVYKIFPKGVK